MNHRSVRLLPVLCISAMGTLVSQGAGQSAEIQCESIEIYGLCGSDYPMQKKDRLRIHASSMLTSVSRTNTFGAVMRIRHNMAMAIHTSFPWAWIFLFQCSCSSQPATAWGRSDVPGNNQEPLQPEEDRGWQNRLFWWFLRQVDFIDRFRSVGGWARCYSTRRHLIPSVQPSVQRTVILLATWLSSGW